MILSPSIAVRNAILGFETASSHTIIRRSIVTLLGAAFGIDDLVDRNT